MNKRLDPTQKIKDFTHLSQSQSGVVNTGDRAKTMIFDEDGPGSFVVIGTSAVENVFDRLEKTNDGRTQWGEKNNLDGESRNKLDLFDAQGEVSDDFVALLKEALEGDEGITLNKTYSESGDYVIEMNVEGSWSTDILKFSGDYVEQAMKIVAIDDPSGYAAAFGPSSINNGDNTTQIGVYEFTLAKDKESFYWSNDKNLNSAITDNFDRIGNGFQDEDAVVLVNLALSEKFGLERVPGLEYVTDDGGAIVIDLETSRGPIDTVVLHGDEIEAAIDAFGTDLSTNANTGDFKDSLSFFDTDDYVSGVSAVFLGGGRNNVTYDAAETIAVGSISQREDNPNRQWQDTIDAFIFNTLKYDGESDVSISGGGEQGDDFIKVDLFNNGATDTVILTGDRVEAAIDHYYTFGTQFDFFA